MVKRLLLDMLEGKKIDYKYGFSDIFHSGDCIKMATGKWRSIYFRQDVRKHPPISSHKTSYTFQLLQISDAMRPEDDSCTDKVKEMCPRSKF